MNKLVIIAAALLISCNVFAQDNIKSIDISTAMPMSELKMQTADKKAVALADVKTNNGLVVMFSCNTCPVVVKSQERTKEMIAYAKKMGLGVVVVNSSEGKRSEGESLKDMARYAKQQGYDAPYVLDEQSKLADAFGATRTPEVFLFDGNGTLMYKGAIEDNPTNPAESKQLYLKNAIEQMSAGMVPEPSSTKSIGCAIKRAS